MSPMKTAVPELYKPAEACRVAEVAPYVLRYWETEFPALSEGKEKGAPRSYTERDVRLITRIRELLYDEGFTVAGAKKRLEAEIAEGRFDEGLKAAPPPAAQRTSRSAPPTPLSREGAAAVPPVIESAETAFLAAASPVNPGAAFPERKRVIRELKEITRLL